MTIIAEQVPLITVSFTLDKAMHCREVLSSYVYKYNSSLRSPPLAEQRNLGMHPASQLGKTSFLEIQLGFF